MDVISEASTNASSEWFLLCVLEQLYELVLHVYDSVSSGVLEASHRL